MRRSRKSLDGLVASGEDGVANTAQRLAVLLEAGVTPTNAWLYLADSSQRGLSAHRNPRTHDRFLTQTEKVVHSTARSAARGVAVDQAIAAAAQSCEQRTAEAWRALAAAWMIARTTGAPLADCLRDLSESLRAFAQLHRDIGVALAAPVATARFMSALPVVSVVFGVLLGFDTLGTLFATLPGLVCLGAGLGLIVVSKAWNSHLVRAAAPKTITPGLLADLLAVAVSGGVSIERARQTVSTACTTYRVARLSDEAHIDAVFELSRRAGVPAAEILRSEAGAQRRNQVTLSQRQAAALSVRLMLPLGLCVLPAFMLLGVAPLVIAVISSTVSSW